MRTSFVALSTVMTVGLPVLAQEPGAPPGSYRSSTDITESLETAAASSASAGGWAVRVSPGVSVRRRSSSVPQYAVLHPFSIEIYRILEGSGTLVTGGLLVSPLAESNNPDIMRSEHGISGGLARPVSAGDVLVLQPGTPHWFRAIDGESVTYMETRIRITTHPVQFQQR
jgi:mannose-6-phosphate isomerase-like protein (cupin superfamily)